jgi:RNA polymerase-binding transcription factor DksA
LNPLPQIVSAEWARQLERELNEVTKERDEAVFVTEKVLRDFSEHSRSHCKALDELIAANNRIKRLEEALHRIANTDYRGHRSTESQIAFQVLTEAKP